ncbi:CDP-alcohol phosphatidyltransferase family protein [bacterium]|nr:MAG: CDP-alcohol phosphatidyltransferase family protein [bacterium]
MNRHDSMDRPLMKLAPMKAWVEWIVAHRDDSRWPIRTAARQSANGVTVWRAILIYPVIMGLGQAMIVWHFQPSLSHGLLVTGWLLAASMVYSMDAVDGTLASQGGIESRFGQYFDPLGDKWTIVCTLYSLWQVANVVLTPGWLQLVTTLMICDVVINSLIGAIGLARGVRAIGRPLAAAPKAETWGKRKMYCQSWSVLALVAGLLIFGIAQWLASAILTLTVGLMILAIGLGLLSMRRHWQMLINSGDESWRIGIRFRAAICMIIAAISWNYGKDASYIEPPIWLLVSLIVGALCFTLMSIKLSSDAA